MQSWRNICSHLTEDEKAHQEELYPYLRRTIFMPFQFEQYDARIVPKWHQAKNVQVEGRAIRQPQFVEGWNMLTGIEKPQLPPLMRGIKRITFNDVRFYRKMIEEIAFGDSEQRGSIDIYLGCVPKGQKKCRIGGIRLTIFNDHWNLIMKEEKTRRHQRDIPQSAFTKLFDEFFTLEFENIPVMRDCKIQSLILSCQPDSWRTTFRASARPRHSDHWMAPEITDSIMPYDTRCDAYSMGILNWEKEC